MMLFDKFAPQRKCTCRPGVDGEPTLDPIGSRRDGGEIADERQGQARAISLVSEIRSGNKSQRAMVVIKADRKALEQFRTNHAG
jgi:hypothetical protein